MPDERGNMQLRKTITLWKGLALAVSTVIGSGLLGLPGMSLETGSLHAAAGGWMLISVMVVPLVYIFACLGLRFTSSAGLSKYAQASVGDWGSHAVTAVLCGTFVIGIPVLAWIGGAYTQTMCGLPDGSIVWLAMAILFLSTMCNLLGVAVVNWINTASLMALFVMSGVIVLSNGPLFIKGLHVFGETLAGKGHLSYFDLWRTSALLFWAFIGWENLSFNLEEFKNPSKTIPRVYWLSFTVVMTLYLALSVTTVGAQASGFSVQGESGLASLVRQTPLGVLQTVIMILVIAANACAWIMGASRLYYAAGRDGILPSMLGRLTNRGIPLNSLLASLAIYAVVLWESHALGLSASHLVLAVSQNFLVLYVLSVFAYWKTESRPRRWIIASLCFLSCGFLLSGFNGWIAYPASLLGVGYWNYRRKRHLRVSDIRTRCDGRQ